jgi:hypothetical protein
MSGIKESALVEFHRSLRYIGGVSGLALKARIRREHLGRVLSGERPGRATWKHVFPCLSEDQVEKLKRCACWNDMVEAEWEKEWEARNTIVAC